MQITQQIIEPDFYTHQFYGRNVGDFNIGSRQISLQQTSILNLSRFLSDASQLEKKL